MFPLVITFIVICQHGCGQKKNGGYEKNEQPTQPHAKPHTSDCLRAFSTVDQAPPLYASKPALLRILAARPERIPLAQHVMMTLFCFLSDVIFFSMVCSGIFRVFFPWPLRNSEALRTSMMIAPSAINWLMLGRFEAKIPRMNFIIAPPHW